MTICFEGPSAIGKTVLSRSLSDNHTIIPEVNVLFGKQFGKDLWYYEKQVECYQMSQQSEKDSIFDGDIFQPPWYNRTYNYPSEFHSAQTIHQFYLNQLETGTLKFPEIYFIFETDLNTLKKRSR